MGEQRPEGVVAEARANRDANKGDKKTPNGVAVFAVMDRGESIENTADMLRCSYIRGRGETTSVRGRFSSSLPRIPPPDARVESMSSYDTPPKASRIRHASFPHTPILRSPVWYPEDVYLARPDVGEVQERRPDALVGSTKKLIDAKRQGGRYDGGDTVAVVDATAAEEVSAGSRVGGGVSCRLRRKELQESTGDHFPL